jgi:phosphate transport system permease protein
MIAATLLILSVAVAAAVPLGLGCAIWLSEFSRRESRLRTPFRMVLDALAGVPSIVLGLFGYAFFCSFLDLGFSIWSGGLTLACMMLPILIRTAAVGLEALPDDSRRSAAALGISRVCLLRTVLLPQAAPAITAGLLLAVGRATGETAALIFTSGYVDRMPRSLSDSGRALAVHIYDLSMNVLGGDPAAYGTALVLISMIVLINVGAIAISEFWVERRVSH